MAVCYESVSKSYFDDLVARIVGLRVSRPWQGYATTIFLELGKLHWGTMTHTGKKRRRSTGQATFMIDPQWRVEKRRSVEFASGSSVGRIDKGLLSLLGKRLEAASLTDHLPELQLTFDDGRCLRTFADWNSQPRWVILVRDKALTELAPVWKGIDVDPCLGVQRGRLQVQYCFDDAHIDVRRLRQYRFPPRRRRTP